jgi:hypothetical protein
MLRHRTVSEPGMGCEGGRNEGAGREVSYLLIYKALAGVC